MRIVGVILSPFQGLGANACLIQGRRAARRPWLPYAAPPALLDLCIRTRIFCERHALRYAPVQYRHQKNNIVRGKKTAPRGYSLLSKRARKMECRSVS